MHIRCARGTSSSYRITNHDGQVFAFENYYLAPSTYEAAARRAGFDDFHWVDAMLEPTERDDPYWDDFLTHAPLTAFSASKRFPRTGGDAYRDPGRPARPRM